MLKVSRTILLALIATLGGICVFISSFHGETGPTPKGEILPSGGKDFVFVINNGLGNSVIPDFDAKRGNKIRLAGFGITKFSSLAPRMKAVGANVLIDLPGGQQLAVLNATVADLTADIFQLELDRGGLVQTFADEFDRFSWDSEGAAGFEQEKGTWRTNYGHGPPYWLSSRTLTGSGELEIYADPALKGTGGKPLGINPFSVENGVLNITATVTPESIRPLFWGRPYTSGLITTRGSFSQLYGVFEMRARLPKGRGFWPAFWLTAEGWPPELDIMEVLGDNTTTLFTSWHSKGTGDVTTESVATRVPDLSADFHLYAIDWNKDEIRWYFDGVEVARHSTPADMHQPMYVRANLAVGGLWPKNPDASTHFPAVFAIDWIRVSRRE